MPLFDVGTTKGCCFVAYDGRAGERYRFSDGTVWRVLYHKANKLSGFKAVFLQPESGNNPGVLSFAGTDSLTDVVVDLRQVGGGLPMQYIQALTLARQMRLQYGTAIYFAGHSLGGGLAAYSSVTLKNYTFTVNPAPLVGAAIVNPRAFRQNSQITNYIARNEFVSSSPGRNPGKDIVVPSSGGWFGFFTDHMLANVAPAYPLPVKL
ncbi:MAG: hypothetical protein ACK5NT_11040 [Pyrinomonadaceae bacterium]